MTGRIDPRTPTRLITPSTALTRTQQAERLANLAGTDLDGTILPPSTEGGIDRTSKPWWRR